MKNEMTFEQILETFANMQNQPGGLDRHWTPQRLLAAYTLGKTFKHATSLERWDYLDRWESVPEVVATKTPVIMQFLKTVQDAVDSEYENIDFLNNTQLVALLFADFLTQDSIRTKPNTDLILINKIKEIKNPDLQIAALRKMPRDDKYPHHKTVLTLIGNNPNATVYELFELLRVSDIAQIHDIYNKIFEKAKADFTAELQSSVPNTEKMNTGKSILLNALELLARNGVITSTEKRTAEADIKKMFDVESALIGGIEYVETASKNISLENAKLKSDNVELGNLRTQNAELAAQIIALQKQLRAKESEIKQAQAEIKNQEKTLALKDATLKTREEFISKIKEQAKSVRSGMGSSGVNDLKELIERDGK